MIKINENADDRHPKGPVGTGIFGIESGDKGISNTGPKTHYEQLNG